MNTQTISLESLYVGSKDTERNRSYLIAALTTLALFALFFAAQAMAGGDTTAVDDVWSELSGWAQGAPGKIIAMLSFLSAIWFGIVKPNYTNAVGSLVFCMLMANATDIIDEFLTMSM